MPSDELPPDNIFGLNQRLSPKQIVEVAIALASSNADPGAVLENEVITAWRKLTPADQARLRQMVKGTGIVPMKLFDDAMAASDQGKATETPNAQLFLDEPPLYLHPVNGAELVKEIEAEILKYSVLPPKAETIAALWVIHTYCIDAFSCSPFLIINSPVMRCGKSTLMTTLSRIAMKPLMASNITPSAVFRCITKWQPTLFFDEADTFLTGDNEDMRGILNSGHTRHGAKVIRIETIDGEFVPAVFSTWCPKAIALIGSLPETLMDRGIVLPLQRKGSAEQTQKQPLEIPPDAILIQQKIMRWINDNLHLIEQTEPGAMLPGINDRAGDNFSPLMVIAQLCGETVLDGLKRAMTMYTGADNEDEGERIELLADIKAIFDKKPDQERLFTETLIENLCLIEDSRWSEYNKFGGADNRQITGRRVGQILKPFGIKPRQMRIGGIGKKGYSRQDFITAFERYLPS